MKSILSLTAAALALAVAMPAEAAVTINGGLSGSATLSSVGQNFSIHFNGFSDGPTLIPGLSAILTLTYNGVSTVAGDTVFDLLYTLSNTSSLAGGSRISSFGFNTDPNVKSAAANGTFDTTGLNVNYPVGFGTVEVCAYDGPGGTCTGNGNGVLVGSPGSGHLLLTFAGAVSNITLSSFVDRYQAFSFNGIDSAIGTPVGIPEPATWLLLIAGIGLTGAMLRRQRQTVKARIRFA